MFDDLVEWSFLLPTKNYELIEYSFEKNIDGTFS